MVAEFLSKATGIEASRALRNLEEDEGYSKTSIRNIGFEMRAMTYIVNGSRPSGLMLA